MTLCTYRKVVLRKMARKIKDVGICWLFLITNKKEMHPGEGGLSESRSPFELWPAIQVKALKFEKLHSLPQEVGSTV